MQDHSGFRFDQKESQWDQLERFALAKPDSAEHLIFEAAGFETRKIAVNGIGNNDKNATFAIEVPMLRNGMDPAIREDETLLPKSQLFMNVQEPDSVDLHVLLMDESKQEPQG